MGFRIGMQCFETSEAAHDYMLSQLPPTISQDGQILRPVKNGHSWELNGQVIELSFPECSQAEQITQGFIIGAPILGLFMIVFFFKAAKKLIETLGETGGSGDD